MKVSLKVTLLCIFKLYLLFCVGFLPKMELHNTMPSVVHTKQQSDVEEKSSSENIKWDKEISFEEAYTALEEKFYSFKKVQLTVICSQFRN